MNVRSRRTVLLVIGLTILVGSLVRIIQTFRWHDIALILIQTDLRWFLGGGIATIIVYWLLRTARWALLVGLDETTPLGQLYLSIAVSLGLASITPLQSGEIAKVEWLKQRGKLERVGGYSAFAVERLLDLVVVCILGIVGLSQRFETVRAGVLRPMPFLAGLIVIVVASAWLLRFLRLRGWLGRFLKNFNSLTANSTLLMSAFLLTVASWAVVAAGWYACLRSVSITLGIRDSFALVSLVALVSVSSIVPGGFGILEVGSAEFLHAIGHEQVAAQAGAVMIRAYGFLVLFLAIFHLLLFRLAMFARKQHKAAGYGD